MSGYRLHHQVMFVSTSANTSPTQPWTHPIHHPTPALAHFWREVGGDKQARLANVQNNAECQSQFDRMKRINEH
jgi:hypothetical protein